VSERKDEKTITMTEEQLERIIRSAVRSALRDVKAEDELPGNEVDELQAAPATFSLLGLISTFFLGAIMLICIIVIIACLKVFTESGFSFVILIFGLAFLMIGVLSFLSMREINNTKKTEVISTLFSAIMALSTLIVAIASAYFAYKAL
jgi:predicted phage tail protein